MALPTTDFHVLLTALLAMLMTLAMAVTGPTPLEESQQPNTTYSKIPCDLRPLSGWRDDNGDLYGVGDGGLWWYSVSNKTWTLLVLPKTVNESLPWKVACGHGGRHVAVTDGKWTLLVLALPSSSTDVPHWYNVSNAPVDPQRTWCMDSGMYAQQNVTYRLDFANATWVEQDNTTDMHQNQTEFDFALGEDVLTWTSGGENMYLLKEETSNMSSQLWRAKLPEMDWRLVAASTPSDVNRWPRAVPTTITWAEPDGRLWVWEVSQDYGAMKTFDPVALTWSQVTPSAQQQASPPVSRRLATWTERGNNQLCLLTSTSVCEERYVVGTTWCLHAKIGSTTSEVTSSTGTTTTTTTITVSSSNNVLRQPLPSSTRSTLQDEDDGGPEVEDEDEDFVRVGDASTWRQQQHSNSVFGSIIFFATSLTIFSVVGLVWCVRRCVHFPKEALLLRDPPSVRYTAIPDTVA